jgi:UDP-N-acetyl-2-amino-2-deoxyglucuronate dehydrogenase
MNFALLGMGYVAPRHIKAIHDLGHELVAICDITSNVGIIDRYFPKAKFYDNAEELFYNIPRLGVEYTSICTPNYLHAPQTVAALQAGSNVIVEKPAALSVADLDEMSRVASSAGRTVHTILQLRQNPNLVRLRQNPPTGRHYLRYHTPRGDWYTQTWKGDPRRSGGLLSNIGVHSLDAALWVLGPAKPILFEATATHAAGVLQFARAHVHVDLSINKPACREFCGIDVSDGFTDGHTREYQRILSGEGWRLEDARPALELIDTLRLHL